MFVGIDSFFLRMLHMSPEVAAVTAFATNLSLVLITGVYVVLTWRLARTSESAAKAAAESASAARAS